MLRIVALLALVACGSTAARSTVGNRGTPPPPPIADPHASRYAIVHATLAAALEGKDDEVFALARLEDRVLSDHTCPEATDEDRNHAIDVKKLALLKGIHDAHGYELASVKIEPGDPIKLPKGTDLMSGEPHNKACIAQHDLTYETVAVQAAVGLPGKKSITTPVYLEVIVVDGRWWLVALGPFDVDEKAHDKLVSFTHRMCACHTRECMRRVDESKRRFEEAHRRLLELEPGKGWPKTPATPQLLDEARLRYASCAAKVS